jgi:hypothetical protein
MVRNRVREKRTVLEMAEERLTRQRDFIAEADKVKSIVRNTLLMDASR